MPPFEDSRPLTTAGAGFLRPFGPAIVFAWAGGLQHGNNGEEIRKILNAHARRAASWQGAANTIQGASTGADGSSPPACLKRATPGIPMR
jgi:hypothetical protein